MIWQKVIDMNNRVTIEDIAKKLNKSKGLVSLALSNKYGVSEETRSQIILEAIKMGYPLTKKKTNCSNKSNRKVNIMLVFCSGMLMDDFYWAKVVSGIEQTLRQHKAIVSFMEWNKVDSSEVVVSLYRSECDGIIIVGSPEMELLDQINSIGRPIVLVDSSCISCDYTQVKANNYTGSYLLTQYLYDLGHRHICFFGDTSEEETLAQRKGGVARFLEKNKNRGIQIDFLDARLDKGSQEYCSITQLRKYIRQKNHATAMICANDAIAARAYEAIAEAGLKIPEDISVVGFDNTQKCEWLSPKLTTVFVDIKKMGEIAVALILQYVKQEESEKYTRMQIEIETSIVVRESVKKLV